MILPKGAEVSLDLDNVANFKIFNYPLVLKKSLFLKNGNTSIFLKHQEN